MTTDQIMLVGAAKTLRLIDDVCTSRRLDTGEPAPAMRHAKIAECKAAIADRTYEQPHMHDAIIERGNLLDDIQNHVAPQPGHADYEPTNVQVQRLLSDEGDELGVANRPDPFEPL